MAREIVITDQHVYLNDQDISAFVREVTVESDERVTVALLGKVSDKREKKVKHDRKNTRKA